VTRHHAADLLGVLGGCIEVHPFPEHGELFPADTAENLVRLGRLSHHLGKLAQNLIARGVAVRVVDELEVVEIEHDQRNGLGRRFGAGDGQFETFLEMALVAGAGQRIEAHEALNLLVVGAFDVTARHVLQLKLPDPDPIAVLQHPTLHPVPVQERPVGGPEVDQVMLPVLPLDARVAAAHGIRIHHQLAGGAPADFDHGFAEHGARAQPRPRKHDQQRLFLRSVV
jgi:hypothetical protein